MKDLRNQLYFLTEGSDGAFADTLGIGSLKEPWLRPKRFSPHGRDSTAPNARPASYWRGSTPQRGPQPTGASPAPGISASQRELSAASILQRPEVRAPVPIAHLANPTTLSQPLNPEVLGGVVRGHQATAAAVILFREVWQFRRGDTCMAMTRLTGDSWRSYCKHITATKEVLCLLSHSPIQDRSCCHRCCDTP